MKQQALKEAFLDFTREKLMRQVDDILSAMVFRGPAERETTRKRLIDHLAAQMERTNAIRKKEGISLLNDLTGLSTYILAGMVRHIANIDDFKRNLVKVIGEKATTLAAVRKLGNFPWAWKFDPSGKAAATGGETPATTGNTSPGLRGVLAILHAEWPDMKQVLDMGECDYDLVHNTLVVLPSPETIGSVIRGKRRIQRILERHFGEMNIEVLDPGPLPERTGNDGRGMGVVELQYSYEEMTRERAFPGGFTEDDDRCIGEMLSFMTFAGAAEKEKAGKRLRDFLHSSMNSYNDIRKRKGQPLLKRVRQLPVYELSKLIVSCADEEIFLSRAMEKFPAYHCKSHVIYAAGPFPWAWKFDPKARQKKQGTAKDTGRQDIAQVQVENIETPPQRDTPPAKDATVIVLRTSPHPATVTEEDPEMAEMQRLRDRLTMLESVFKQHIHSKVDGSTYIPFDSAAEAIMFEDVAS